MSLPWKKFKMTNVIESLDNIKNGVDYKKEETHFGVSWMLIYRKNHGFLSLFMKCMEPKDTRKWFIEVDTKFGFTIGKEVVVYSIPDVPFGNEKEAGVSWGTSYLIQWNLLERKMKLHGKLDLEYEVTIKKTNGFENEKLRDFNDKELSDVVLVVEDKKFYSSKMLLAIQSKYFKSMFLGNFKEADQNEVKLEKIESKRFQSFLELLHGESSINDSNIDAILQLADMYDAPMATRRCEEFLLEKSKWTVTEKLELATMYNLGNLKTKCDAEQEETKQEQLRVLESMENLQIA